MKKTVRAFPVAKLPPELRRGLPSVDVVGITIETPEAPAEDACEAAETDLSAPEVAAEQGRRVEAHCARRSSW